MFKSKQFVYYIFLCNLLTNPALNLITLAVGQMFGAFWYKVAQIILEAAVVIIEARIISALCSFAVKKSIMISFALNSISYSIGLLISIFITSVV